MESAVSTPDARLQIAEIGPGKQVEGTFACVRKDLLVARNGTPYLAVELRDRSGSLTGRVFRDVGTAASRFEQGDLVQVSGRSERFRGELQLELDDIRRVDSADLDPTEFLPHTYRDLDELDGFLEHLATEVYERSLRTLLEGLLADAELMSAWRAAPCTKSGHHAYLGGLLEHTIAVAILAQEIAQLHPRLNSDLLLSAALVHDLGKTREFSYSAEISLSGEGRLLGHLTLGVNLLDRHIGRIDKFPEELRLELLHCVACHHGADSVPGRRFRSAEALALYRLNALDAGVKGAFEHGLNP